eukprot:7381795-Prymnesium_polylepis.1
MLRFRLEAVVAALDPAQLGAGHHALHPRRAEHHWRVVLAAVPKGEPLAQRDVVNLERVGQPLRAQRARPGASRTRRHTHTHTHTPAEGGATAAPEPHRGRAALSRSEASTSSAPRAQNRSQSPGRPASTRAACRGAPSSGRPAATWPPCPSGRGRKSRRPPASKSRPTRARRRARPGGCTAGRC